MKKIYAAVIALFLSFTASAQFPELVVNSMTSPLSGSGLTASEPIMIEIFNYGSSINPGDSIICSYSINGGAWVSETFDLPSGMSASINYTFVNEADLSALGAYNFKIAVHHLNELNPFNDTLTANVYHYNTATLTGVISPTVVQDQSNFVEIHGVLTDFFTYELVYFINGNDTLVPTNITPPDFPTILSITLEVPCSKPQGMYDLHVKTTTDGWMQLTDAIEVVSSISTSPYVYDPSCHNDTTGSIDPYPYGGSQSFSYSWSNGSTSPYINNLPAGSYSVTITDDITGCFLTENYTLINPPLLVVDFNKIDPDCGQTNGMAWVSVSGGGTPYDVYWGPGEVFDDTLTGMEANIPYSVEVNDGYGCYFTYSFELFEQLTLDVTSTQVLCGDLDGTASLSIANGVAPFSVLWSNGDNGMTTDSLSNGSYFVQVSDANSCYGSMAFQVLGTDGPQIAAVDVLNPTCGSNPNGSIDITVTGGDLPYTFVWSNGSVSEDLSNVPSGTYQVTVTDAGGCSVAQCFSINDENIFRYDGFYAAIEPDCGGGTNGEVAVFTFGGVEPYAIQWDAAAGNQTDFYAVGLSAGFYSFVITDATGCSDSASISLSEYGSGYYYTDNYVNGTCGSNDASIEITPSGGFGPNYTVVWDGNITSEDLYNAQPGIHQLSITDNGGCEANFHVFLYSDSPLTEEICIVTVDTLTGMNLVVWQKDAATNISHYNIYRETCGPNGFEFVGSVPYDSLSQFIDYGADAKVQSWKYRIAVVDDCGNESEFSDLHKTIHMSADRTAGTSVDLSWDEYLGFSFTEQIIWRHHSSTGWMIIDTVPSTQFSYTDLTPPNVDSSEYFIEVYAPATCVADRAINHNSTRSNRGTVAAPFNSITEDYTIQQLFVYPNPSNGIFNLNMSSVQNEEASLYVYDLSGRLVMSRRLNIHSGNNNYQLNLSEFGNGIYQIVLSGEKTQYRARIAKQ